MSRHKWEPIGLRGRRKECKVCGCIKREVNLTVEYEMPGHASVYGKAPECKKQPQSLENQQQNKP